MNKDKVSKYVAIAAVIILAATAFAVFSGPRSGNEISLSMVSGSIYNAAIEHSVYMGADHYTTPVYVMISLKYRNENELNQYLQEVSTPGNPIYRHYINESEFVRLYSPTESQYSALENYLTANGMKYTTYGDRISINVVGTAQQFDKLFHTEINLYKTGSGRIFYANSIAVEMPSDITPLVNGIVGLNNYVVYHSDIVLPHGNHLYQLGKGVRGNYIIGKGVGVSNVQLTLPGDLQVAYQEKPIFNAGIYPSKDIVATVLWAGTNGGFMGIGGTPVGAYDPTDVNTFLNNTLPKGEPMPVVKGVPVNGAVAPGISATNDSTGANFENTLDVEYASEMAPGATVECFYGPSASSSSIDGAFTKAVNTPGVVVISNSWGGSDQNDSTYDQQVAHANAIGITVLASSGDSGNSAVGFPSTDGHNGYGVVAVGGTTITYTGTPGMRGENTTGIANQVAWFDSNWGAVTGQSQQYIGSTSGVSSVFSEPTWQSGSADAGKVISGVGNGRATADISAVGNNSLIYISIANQTTGAIQSGYMWIAGTSIASPATAGEIATMDGYITAKGGSTMGFMDPVIYRYGDMQYSGKYSSAPPFYDVTQGATSTYTALKGWDFPTGWGSINAWNFVNIVLNGTSSGGGSGNSSAPLTATATATPTVGTAPLTVSFAGSAGGGVSPYNYSWNFGNGATGNSQKISYTYTAAGNYTATLTVTDKNSVKAQSSVSITVNAPSSGGSNGTAGSLKISDIKITTTTYDIFIQWNTNIAANSSASIGSSSGSYNYGNFQGVDSDHGLMHNVTVGGATPGTVYYLQLYGTSTNGNATKGSVASSPMTVTTDNAVILSTNGSATGTLYYIGDGAYFVVNVTNSEYNSSIILYISEVEGSSGSVYNLYEGYGYIPTTAVYDNNASGPDASLFVPMLGPGFYYIFITSSSGTGSFSINASLY